MCQCNAGRATAAAIMIGVTLLVAEPTTAQTSKPVEAAGSKSSVKIKVWTCPAHEQVRMPGKGTCPMCDAALKAEEIQLHGLEALGDPYPLETCPVSGEKLGSMGEPLVLAYDNREVRLCCKGCVGSFEKNPDKYWGKVDEQIARSQHAVYPLQTCPVSGDSLDKPDELIYENRLIRLCCKMCKRDFLRSPARYLATLDAAVIAEQGKHYPLDTCMVSGGKLDSMGGPIEAVFGNRLVRFCCAGCLPAFWKAPSKYYRELDKAWAKQGHTPRSHGESGDKPGKGHGHDHDHDHGH